MSEAKKYRVRFISDEGEMTVFCYGVQERDGDRVRIGDCIFRDRDIISVIPVEEGAAGGGAA